MTLSDRRPRRIRRGSRAGAKPLLQKCEGNPEAFMQVELGMSDASVVSNRNLGDRDALQGALREQVRLQVEPGGGQAKGLEPIGSEAPHPAADVGDRGREQERSEPAQEMVPGSIRQGHRTVVDLTTEARSEDDGTSAGGLTGAAGIENGLIGGPAGARAPMAPPDNGHSSAGCPILLSPSNNYRFLTADPTRIDLKTVRTESRETLTSIAASLPHSGNAASGSARSHSERCSRPSISCGIHPTVCYLISGTRFADTIRHAIRRWREQKRRFCSFNFAVRVRSDDGKQRDASASSCAARCRRHRPGQGYLFEGIHQWVHRREGEGTG